MRVRHVVKGLGPGGAERLVVSIATAAGSDADHDVVHLLAHKNHLVPELEAASVPVSCLDSRRGTRLGWVLRLRRLLRSDPVDIVHVHSPAVAAVTRLVARTLPAASRPVVVGTEHNRWPRHHPVTRLANRLTIRFEQATIAVSDDVARTVRGTRDGQVRTILHGIDLDHVRTLADRRAARDALGITDDDVVAVCVANFRREKALEVLVEAAALAVKEEPRLLYLLVGQGPLETDIRQWVDAAALGDRFRVIGYRDDVPFVVSGADFLTLSSRHEGLPVAIMEALALGVPVVATRAGGTAVAVGSAGLLSPVDDPDALARNHVAIASDPDLRQRLARAADDEANRFSIRRALAELEAVYAATAV